MFNEGDQGLLMGFTGSIYLNGLRYSIMIIIYNDMILGILKYASSVWFLKEASIKNNAVDSSAASHKILSESQEAVNILVIPQPYSAERFIKEKL